MSREPKLRLVRSFSELQPGIPVVVQCDADDCVERHEGMILKPVVPGQYGLKNLTDGAVELVPAPHGRWFIIQPSDVRRKLVYIRVDPTSDAERERERRNRERDERLSKMRDMMDSQKKEMDREAAREAEKYYGPLLPRRLP